MFILHVHIHVLPEHLEAFKQAGVDDFIHLRANCHDLLANLQAKAL